MDELERRIAGDLYDLRQAIESHHEYEDYLGLTAPELSALMRELRLAVELGTIEVKRAALNSIFAFVESLQYDTRSFQNFNDHVRTLVKTTYLVLLQHSYATRELTPRRSGSAPSDPLGDATRQIEFKTIVENVQQRIAQSPELKTNPAVKNILMQVSVYRRELTNMKELAPNIPREKQASFTANFKKTFAEITRKVQDNYAALMRELEPPAEEPSTRNMFQRFDLSTIAKVMRAQAEDLSRIRSILAYAGRERYKTREILSAILRSRDRSLALVERELTEYENLWFDHGPGLAREFAGEVAEYLARKLPAPASDG